MTEERDPLEAELQSLWPPPPAPELQRRIAERLASTPVSQAKRRRRWRVAVVGGLAASLAVAVVLWRGGNSIPHPGGGIVPPPPAEARVEVEGLLPTLQAYRLALAESPEALVALLDRHAVRSAGAAPSEPLRASALSFGNFLD